jgi:hypothetical protein
VSLDAALPDVLDRARGRLTATPEAKRVAAVGVAGAARAMSDTALRSVYALTVLRLVNGVVDPSQKGR